MGEVVGLLVDGFGECGFFGGGWEGERCGGELRRDWEESMEIAMKGSSG